MSNRIKMFRLSDHTVCFPDGEVIFIQGERGNEMYVVQEGIVRIVKDGAIIARLKGGELVGELSFLTGEPHMASAIAEGPVKLAPIDESTFRFLIDHSRPFVQLVMQALSERVYDTWKRVRLP